MKKTGEPIAQNRCPDNASGHDAAHLDLEVIDAWVRQAQAGDRAAMEQLLSAFKDRVWRRALYRLGDHDEAWDVAQNFFIICFRKIGQFRAEAQFWTWLARIVDNQVKNRLAWWSRRGKQKTFSLDDLASGHEEDPRRFDPPATEPSPRQMAAGREEVVLMEERLARLSPDHREILLLRFADELSYEEIAESLQISLGTVKSRISRARNELKALMADVRD